MYFDRVYFWHSSGNNSDINEVGVDAQSAYECCVKCQTAVRPLSHPSFPHLLTPHLPKPEGCSQAFFVPGELKCQMRLRLPLAPSASLPFSSSSVIPLGTGTGMPTALPPASTGVVPNPVCPAGSLTEYVGVIRGRECFKPELAWSFINGPCGRLSINPVAVDARGNGVGGNGTETATCSLVGTPTATVAAGAVPTTVLARAIGGMSF